MLNIDALEKMKNHSILIYGVPHSKVLDSVINTIYFFIKNNHHVFLIDANHQITPSSLLNIDDEYLSRLCLFKPDTLESISRITDFLVFSTIKFPSRLVIILNSLYIQIPYYLWHVLKYDPLYIMYGLTSLPKRKHDQLVIISIDTYVKELESLPYKDLIKKNFDIIMKRNVEDKYISFEVEFTNIK